MPTDSKLLDVISSALQIGYFGNILNDIAKSWPIFLLSCAVAVILR